MEGGKHMTFKKIALTIGLLMFGFMATGTIDLLVQPETAEAVFGPSKKISADPGTGEAKSIVKKIFEFANVFAGIVLAISIVMIILGGLRYITAQGDQKNAEQGKMILLYSGIGIIIALSAFALGRFFQGFAV
jgi:hypothetical protein